MADAKPPLFVGTLRIVYTDESEVSANLTADRLCSEISEWLDEDDTATVTQVIPFTTNVSPEETLTVFKRARNALIRQRHQESYDLARLLDMYICKITHATNTREADTQYDYSRMPRFVEHIFIQKGEPDE